MTDYTPPTTEDIRTSWTFYEGDRSEAAAQFDRWLAFVKDMAYWEGYGDGQDSERGFN